MRGKNAIVTGGNGAIGRAIALNLAHAGCNVAVIDLACADDVCAAIAATGNYAAAVTADLSNPAAARAAIASATEALGGFDILVNAAGIVSAGSFAKLAGAEWDRVLATNLTSVFTCCQAAIAPLRQRQLDNSGECGGRIINIGSVLAKNGGNARPWIDPAEQDRSGNVAYAVSKAGVHTLTSYLARELAADGITVNAVAPGPIATAMTTSFPEALKSLIPAGRMGTAADVAAVVAFLAGAGAAYVTGEIIDVNGGLWSD
ncbi:MAG: SDR family oxidoreductase [Novosphingobium sp.]|uniref:SDR family NAD(P)-dependent oxidoreductase n=1 Tax=Novosphingobium sp. TaxID=1874826 RepID=UPI002734455F|nr:SDR family oxidoreductase [Novosphingobium sp.]MDP3550781.1 SDR family oxidoreductase [Novosphingobium sp.]